MAPRLSASRLSPIGPRVRALREARRWSQAELARELGLSQPRLSQIERGQGSFTAEQLLRILAIFNVGVEHFAGGPVDRGSSIQNALARHGAAHLVEGDALVPARLADPIEVVADVLRAPESPRHVAALAPVLIASIDHVALPEIASRLARAGREQRLGWVLESTLAAIAAAGVPARAPDRRQLRRAELAIDLALSSGVVRPPAPGAPLDVLDHDIRSKRTVHDVAASAAPEARRWHIVTRIRTADFADALKAARDAR